MSPDTNAGANRRGATWKVLPHFVGLLVRLSTDEAHQKVAEEPLSKDANVNVPH